MELSTFLAYLVTWTAVALTPGPAVMYSMATATRYGLRASLAGIFGIQAGNFVLFTVVALGLGTLLAKATVAFALLRVLGAVYLFWLGGSLICRSFRSRNQTAPPPASTELDSRKAAEGLLIQVTNPKAVLFVTALLPQFIQANHSPYFQFSVLVLTTISVDLLVLFGYALLAHAGASSFSRGHWKAWSDRVCGVVLICFGGRLLFSRK